MWFRLRYRDTTGRVRRYIFSARDPAMMIDYLKRAKIMPHQVEKLWIDEGDGFEPWDTRLLNRIWEDTKGDGKHENNIQLPMWK